MGRNLKKTIQAIAILIREKKEQGGKKCVLMLGAGASMSSGVPKTDQMMTELLERAPDLTEGTLRERFDRLWARSDQNTRDRMLKPYLEKEPSEGYFRLAELINEGCFDTIITFNFDELLETALRRAGCTDVLTIVRGEYKDDEKVCLALQSDRPRVKILKMHGGLKGGDTFLFTTREMNSYPKRIKDLLLDLTRQDILVCGYAFEDRCVEAAFSKKGGSIFCVNPTAPPKLKGGAVIARNSEDYIVDGDEYGRFDSFFKELQQALKPQSKVTVLPTTVKKANPFKFLVSYDVRDRDWFFGRTKLKNQVLRRFQDVPPKVLHLFGPPKAGKTSFVRAGLIANLDPARFQPMYLRCQDTLAFDAWLSQAISVLLTAPAPPNETAAEAVCRLAASTSKHVVVVLDQFERMAARFPNTDLGQHQLKRCLQGLCDCAASNLSFVCVCTNTQQNYTDVLPTIKADSDNVRALPKKIVGGIVGRMARRAEIEFSPEVIKAIMDRYEKNPSFTLAHVQAVCNILAGDPPVDLTGFEEVIEADGQALDVALNVCDIVSCVEDIPDDKRRDLFRKVMKVIPVESKKVLAAYLKENFADLFTPPEIPKVVEIGKAVQRG